MNSKILKYTCQAVDELSGLKKTPLSIDTIVCRYYRLGEIEDMYFEELLQVQGEGSGKYRNLGDEDREILNTYHALVDEERYRLRNSATDINVVQGATYMLAARWDELHPDGRKPMGMVVYTLAGKPCDEIWDITIPSMSIGPVNMTNWTKSLLQSPVWMYDLMAHDVSRTLTQGAKKTLSDVLSQPYADLTADEVQAIATLWTHKQSQEFSNLAVVVQATKKLL